MSIGGFMNFRRGVGEGLAAVGGYQSWLEGMRVEKPVFSREIEKSDRNHSASPAPLRF